VRLRADLEATGHGADIDGPLFRPLHHNGKRQDERLRMDPDAIDPAVRKYAVEVGIDRGYSAHSMRATIYHHRARERRPAQGRAESHGALRPEHDEAQ
jgi:hypothetical protein